MLNIQDRVFHKDYPNRKGKIVAKTKKWPGELQTFLVRWDTEKVLSRHIENALVKVD